MMKFLKEKLRLTPLDGGIALLLLTAVLLGALIPNQQTKAVNQRAVVDNSAQLAEAAEAAVKALEEDPNEDNLIRAQAAVDKVTDKAGKEEFQKRIDAVRAELGARADAEAAVKNLEENQTTENVAPAQEAVGKVGDEKVKAAFQERIDAVKAAIQARQEASRRSSSSSTAASSSSSTAAGGTDQIIEEQAPATGGYTYSAPAGGETTTPAPSSEAPAPAPTVPETPTVPSTPTTPTPDATE